MKTDEKLIKKLTKHYNESTNYLTQFYEQCEKYEVEDLEWIKCDKDFDNFLSACPLEYTRIYDMAIKNLSGDLLADLGVKVNN